jgi:hypothetical protein
MQAERERHDLLAENWRRKASEFQKNLETIHSAIRRMDDITAREASKTAAQ